MILREIRAADISSLIALYDRSFPSLFPSFCRPRGLTDPFDTSWFDPAGAVVAEEGNRIVGYALAQTQPENSGVMLMTLFVDPVRRRQGVGSQLLDHVKQYGCHRSKRYLRIGPGAPDYFTLGLALDSPEQSFFQKRGFVEDPEFGYRPIWMGMKMTDWTLPARMETLSARLSEEGISVRLSAPSDTPAILQMTERHFSGWHKSSILPNFQKADPAPLAIAILSQRVIAFAGPLYIDPVGRGYLVGVGVDPEFRRKGLAHAVFNTACSWWKANSAQEGFLWTGTGNPAVKAYASAGWRIIQTYVVMRCNLA
jgi:GNAT superfamily N-acetyltransferase